MDVQSAGRCTLATSLTLWTIAPGKLRTLSAFKCKVIVLFFGYTQCSDVCPTTLSVVDAALKELGAKANDVQVLFVTVDLERDTQELLAQYVPAFIQATVRSLPRRDDVPDHAIGGR